MTLRQLQILAHEWDALEQESLDPVLGLDAYEVFAVELVTVNYSSRPCED